MKKVVSTSKEVACCDICEIQLRSTWNEKCAICGREICVDCMDEEERWDILPCSEMNEDGEIGSVVCVECARSPLAAKISKEHDESSMRIAALFEEWKKFSHQNSR
jgi:hypothetical protein